MAYSILTRCRSWLFVPGHDTERLADALTSGAEAIVVDLEEFTPAASGDAACQAFTGLAESCRQKGRLPMVRINALDRGGRHELALLMGAAPAAVFLPQVDETNQLEALASALDSEERRWGIPPGTTAIVPTLESRLGVERANDLLRTSPRIAAALLGTGDLVRDLGLSAAERSAALAPFRQRFLKACDDTDILAIDGPWPETHGFDDDQVWSRQCGFRARCVVDTRQVEPLHRLLATPSSLTIHSKRSRT